MYLFPVLEYNVDLRSDSPAVVFMCGSADVSQLGHGTRRPDITETDICPHLDNSYSHTGQMAADDSTKTN